MFVIFDLDGTLAKVGESATEETVRLLHRIRESGADIAISSGKPTYYLCGFARQVGLHDAFLIGENGAVLQKGTSLPPALYEKAPIPEKTRKALHDLRLRIEEAFPERMWYQPNETALTPFLHFEEDFVPLEALLNSLITPEMELCVYRHADCFDIVYKHLSKADGLRLLERVTGAKKKDMIAVGDWTNDYPMFQEAGYSVGISLPDPTKADVNFDTIEEALEHILTKQ